jgi:hypothetical protein
MNPRHGEVWLVDMGMAAKTRPAVVLLADNLNAPRSLIIQKQASYCQVRRIGDSGVRPSSGAASTESCETVEFSGAYLRCHVAAPADGRTPPLSCIPPSPQYVHES